MSNIHKKALALLCAGGIFAGMFTAVSTVFHAYGDFVFPIKAVFTGGLLKLVLNVLLIPLPFMNISGAAAAAVISNVVCLAYSVRAVHKMLSAAAPRRDSRLCAPPLPRSGFTKALRAL